MLSDEPLVTVGLPTYNRPVNLRQALECLMKQSYKNLEIIVSDNASPGDDTRLVIEEFSQRDPRIKHIRQPGNIGAARNFTFVFEQATGKYFTWFADDDHCEEGFIEALVSQMEADSDIAAAMSDVRFVDELGTGPSVMHLSSIRWEEARDDWRGTRVQFFVYPTSHIFLCVYGLFRTELLRRCRTNFQSKWKNLTFAAEVPFLAQLAVLGKIVSVPRTLKTYRFHKDSMYVKEQSQVTRLDRLIRGTEVRLQLTSIALRSDLPLSDRIALGAAPWPLAQKALRLLQRERR